MFKRSHSKTQKRSISLLFRSLIIPLAFFLCPDLTLDAKPINLNRGDVYVRRGFEKSWTEKMPAGKEWLKIGSPEKLRSFRIKDLGLEGIPKRGFFSFKRFREEDFTFIFPFRTGGEIPGFPGILIQDLGMKWEVYINGKLIIRNMDKGAKNGVRNRRSLRNILAFINPGYLKDEGNIAAFRVSGSPVDPLTGFYRNRIVIDDYEELNRKRSEITTLILIFIYLSFGLYHIFFYINNRRETHYLFFGLASISYFLYILSRTRSIYGILSSPHLVTKLEFIILYTLIPLFGSFIDLVIFRRIKRFTLIYSLFSAALIAMTPFTPLAFSFDVLRVWQYTAFIPLFNYAFMVLAPTFFGKIRVRYAGTEGKRRFRILIRTVIRSLVSSSEGNLIIGFFIIAGCTIFDILDSIYFKSGFITTRYGFFFFFIGTGLILSNRFLFMLKRIESLNISLTRKIEDLNTANTAITISEEKYRMLVEGSNDMIFSLDENLRFITANKSLKNILNVDDRELREKSFTDLIQSDNEGKTVSLQFIREKIDILIEKRIPVQFNTSFRSRLSSESQEMHIRLEYINVEGKNEILGKATSIVEDSLIKYFVTEKQSYAIGNFLIIAEEISHRITRNLLKYLEQRSVDIIRVAVREIIVNAIEHGNLEISYEEKNRTMEKGAFYELFSLRQEDPSLRKRKVKIEYKIDKNRAQYLIEDEGGGFDHQTVLGNINKANMEMRAHGRGILMAKNVFDSIKFNKRGNRVLLIKNF